MRSPFWEISSTRLCLLLLKRLPTALGESLVRMTAEAYALNTDGSARDPVAFRAALQADEDKLSALQKEPEVAKVVLGDDVHAFQELLKSVYRV